MHMTHKQAADFLARLYSEPDEGDRVHVQAIIPGYSEADVRAELATFCDDEGLTLGPDTITMVEETIESLDLPATIVTIKTGE